MELLIQGLAAMLTAQNILFIFFGTALGIIFGAIPGSEMCIRDSR